MRKGQLGRRRGSQTRESLTMRNFTDQLANGWTPPSTVVPVYEPPIGQVVGKQTIVSRITINRAAVM